MIPSTEPRPVSGFSVIHVLADIDNKAAGPSYSVPMLACAQQAVGARVEMMTTGIPRQEYRAGVQHTCFARDFASIPILTRLGASRALSQALTIKAREVNVVHSHGLWLLSNAYPGDAVTRKGAHAKLVLAPRGMLGRDALHFSSRMKKLSWIAYQRRTMEAAGCLHATAESELEDIRAFGIDKPIAVVPNGIDLPDLSDVPRGTGAGRVVLTLGRIHPKKGLERLVRAWAALETTHPAWRLRIVGPAENGHDRELSALASTLRLSRVSIEGPLYGRDRLDAYRGADVFVLPTLHENFGMTVAEALAAEVPVISSKGAPWRGLASEHCGWWIDHGVEPLAAALKSAMQMPREELARMGARGRHWMLRDFSWDRMAREMDGVYRWLCEGGDRPINVHLSQSHAAGSQGRRA